MKMTKKIMAVAVAAVVALTFVGCPKMGDVNTSGTKWAKTFKLDATGDIKDAKGADATYARGFAALSASTKCYEIETTITLPVAKAENIVLTEAGKKSVVGLAFDVHLTKDANNKEFYDFVLVGVKPSDGGFYIERYSKVAKANLKDSMNTTMGNIDEDAEVKFCDGKASTATWANGTVKTADPATVTTDGYSWTVKVTQETAGKYEVYINDTKLGTWERELTDAEKADKTHDGKAYGQVFMYGNAPKGTKINAKYTSNKENTKGLFADEEEF